MKHTPAKTDDTPKGGAPSPLTTTSVAKVARQTRVGVVAQKNTHQASTYFSVLSADTLLAGRGHGGRCQPKQRKNKTKIKQKYIPGI